MPFTNSSPIVPLSNFWTHYKVVSEVEVLTNTINNEDIQYENYRYHMNKNISHIARLINMANLPWYGIWLMGELETAYHMGTGLHWIDLTKVTAEGFTPATQVDRFTRLGFFTETNSTAWVGNATQKDIGELLELNSYRNRMWRFSVAWAHWGSDILVYIGDEIYTQANQNSNAAFSLYYQKATALAYRKPLLDQMVNWQDKSTGNFYSNVDLPDDYMDLLVKMTTKDVLEQLNQPVPQQLEQEIVGTIQLLNGTRTTINQYQQVEADKGRVGRPRETV